MKFYFLLHIQLCTGAFFRPSGRWASWPTVHVTGFSKIPPAPSTPTNPTLLPSLPPFQVPARPLITARTRPLPLRPLPQALLPPAGAILCPLCAFVFGSFPLLCFGNLFGSCPPHVLVQLCMLRIYPALGNCPPQEIFLKPANLSSKKCLPAAESFSR